STSSSVEERGKNRDPRDEEEPELPLEFWLLLIFVEPRFTFSSPGGGKTTPAPATAFPDKTRLKESLTTWLPELTAMRPLLRTLLLSMPTPKFWLPAVFTAEYTACLFDASGLPSSSSSSSSSSSVSLSSRA